MTSTMWPAQVHGGAWTATRASGELSGPGGVQRLEPKLMDLLCVLASEPGRVWSREELMALLWPGVVVGDDSLARAVSRLRQALEDDAKAPRFIETIAKRGYRWIAESTVVPGNALPGARPEAATLDDPAAVAVAVPTHHRSRQGRSLVIATFAALGLAAAALLAWNTLMRDPLPATPSVARDTTTLLTRADHYYFQFSRADNEAALELYQRVLGLDPDNPAAMAGMANALAQRAIRWPGAPGPEAVEFTRLGDALAHGHMARDPARSQLQRARQLARTAVARAPASAGAYKALGLVLSAQGELEAGLAAHQRAVQLDPDAWGAMINIADLQEQLGREDEALQWFERAYEVMARTYDDNPVQVRHWHEALGVLVADRYRTRGDLTNAEAGYRRVLTLSPLHEDATRGLAAVLSAGGDQAAATRMCRELELRLGRGAACTQARH
ncbi:winged helix-turn-helix domain-containing protein [Luteimonas kalidii]|uniref:Winged helix-turn-helix domain-containing protein n=1 Tax=Luteimonas kalidii TaxID=3042025 RepID=A0ABT6JSC7_9GAMM|nr:winged helix-turn-helix domain-containing protein [Luteimonas kalidii]MDH5833591.1 winged helix-turn-helix domain-containing protein [Luteimonas kalidii]